MVFVQTRRFQAGTVGGRHKLLSMKSGQGGYESIFPPCLPMKWNQSSHDVKVGDLVLIVDEKNQRGDWSLARIVKTL